MRKSRILIIKNKLFNNIWKLANKSKYKNFEEFVNVLKEEKIKLDKYEIDYVQYIELAKKIYDLSSITFKELINMVGKRKIDISDVFCIPIRTIEDWYAGKRSCPDYIRLMICKQYHLLDLGKYAKLESEIEYMSTLPSIYKKKKEKIKKLESEQEIELINNQKEVIQENELENLQDNLNYDLKENIQKNKQDKENDLIKKDVEFFNKYGYWPKYRKGENGETILDYHSEEECEFFSKYGFWPPKTTMSTSEKTRALLDKLSYLDRNKKHEGKSADE